MEDTDLMPWGKFKGVEMQNVPAYYLIWLIDNHKFSGNVKRYIKDNLEVIESELEND